MFTQRQYITSINSLTRIQRTTKKKKKNIYIYIVLKNLGADRNKDADIENGLEDTGKVKGKVG